jgi:Flp pilus assembly protein TadG
MWRRRKKDRGQDLVEYAIVFPVLMLLVLGVFEFGRIIYSYNAISNLAREGVRYAVVPAHQDEITDITEQPCPGSNGIVQNVCSHALALPGTLKVSVSQENASGQPDPDVVHVEVAYEGEFLTSYVRETLDPCQCDLVLRAAATMRLE